MAKTNKFCALIPSFAADAAGAFEVTRSLQREFPGLPVRIAEDSRAPFAAAQRRAFADAFGDVVSFVIRESNGFGNLRGIAHIREQLALMREFCADTGATHCFKCDSDFVVNPAGLFDWLDKCAGTVRAVFPNTKGGVNVAVEKFPDGWGYGFCYVLRSDAIDALVEHFAGVETLADGGEDIEISGACLQLFPGKIGWIPFGRFVGYNYTVDGKMRPVTDAVEQWKRGLAVSMFGNRYSMPQSWSDAAQRQVAAQFARYLNDAIDAEQMKGRAHA